MASGGGASSPRKELCLLALDGGGVRGLSSLYILKQLMESIDPEAEKTPLPCEYFDMIGGTSTGGLIALMLGRLGMSVDECIAEYTALSSEVFTHLQRRMDWKFRLQGRFDHKSLEKRIKALLVERGEDPDALLSSPNSSCKTKQTSDTVVLSSYFSRRRGLDMLNTVKFWEAARATSAATTFFDDIKIGGEGFVDGATGQNSPIATMWTEAGDIFKQKGAAGWRLEDHVQCFVSIGTGVPSLQAFGESLLDVAKTIASIATDSMTAAEDFQRHHSNMVSGNRFFRFNVQRGLETVGLEEAKKQDEIKAATRKYIQEEVTFNHLERCAENLQERECGSLFA
ncbi:Calcium-independent phospholipase A2-gamma [Lachnellula suecica]|uniref:Calcium-independent phospholipase A2-gamma n=1 Tax=Lachnellula suecica TaxID=602035 RepID=A0A8T9BTZ8_9HELO|nr:Calcium-independent phospholipase A2-gamma [Lachnellula suecica]